MQDCLTDEGGYRNGYDGGWIRIVDVCMD